MLSKKTQYAFQALMYLAEKGEKGKESPVLIAEIAKKKKIPLKFLENILLEMKNAGILESSTGYRYAPARRSYFPPALRQSVFL